MKVPDRMGLEFQLKLGGAVLPWSSVRSPLMARSKWEDGNSVLLFTHTQRVM